VIRHFLETITKDFVYTIDFAGLSIKRKGGIGFLRTKNFNSKEKEFLRSLKLEQKIIYDIGSHIGIFSIFFSKVTGPNGCVVAFEPNKENRQKMLQNICLNEIINIEIIDYAVSDKTESNHLFVRRGSSASGSMLKTIQSTISDENYYDIIKVKVDKLDNLQKDKHLPVPDFIKIDIEGMEYHALLGMQNILTKYHPELYIEIHGADPEDKIYIIENVYQLLKNWGYSSYHVETGTILGDDNWFIANVGHIYCTYIIQ